MSEGEYRPLRTIAAMLCYVGLVVVAAAVMASEAGNIGPVGITAGLVLLLAMMFGVVGRDPEAFGLRLRMQSPQVQLYSMLAMILMSVALVAMAVAKRHI